MKVYAVMRSGHRLYNFDWQIHKLFKDKEDAVAWVKSKNPNACRYDYKVKAIKVE